MSNTIASDDLTSLLPAWSKYIPIDPTPIQLGFLIAPHFEVLYGGALGGGKILYDDAQILTPFGFKQGRDVKVGDRICAVNGGTTEIIWTTEYQRHQVWRVHFHDGTFTDVAEGHQWLAWRASTRRKSVRGSLCGESSAQVVTTKRLKEWCDQARHTRKTKPNSPAKWPLIPVCAPQNFNVTSRSPADLDPYQLGYWLGDGSTSSGSIVFTTADHKHFCTQFDYQTDLAFDGRFGWRLRGKSATHWKTQLQKLDLFDKRSATKFVPREYLYGPQPERLALLQGLMDTDGTVDSRGQCYFCSISHQLAQDVAFLVRSLGGTARITHKLAKLKSRDYQVDAWSVYIRFPIESQLFRLSRKQARCAQQNDQSALYRRVVKVEVLPTYNTGRCISVSDPTGLYITNDFIVTHNSIVLLAAATMYVDQPNYDAVIFRKSYADLARPGALLDVAFEWWAPWIAAKEIIYDPKVFCFRFPSGSTVSFGYMGRHGAQDAVQGAQYDFVGIDEAGQHSEEDANWAITRIRTKTISHIPPRMRYTANPGGRGAVWLKKRFGIKRSTTLLDERGMGRFVGTNKSRLFIPARLIDNPHLQGTAYAKRLQNLDKVTRDRLLYGDWDAADDGRYQREWFDERYTYDGPHIVTSNPHNEHSHRFPHTCFQLKFATMDIAASERQGVGGQSFYVRANTGEPIACWTALGVWGVYNNRIYLLEVIRRQLEIPDLFDLMRDTLKRHHPTYFCIEQNGVGMGAVQMAARMNIPVKPIHTNRDKLVNAYSSLQLARDGRIILPTSAPWLQDLEDELFYWTGNPSDVNDQIDMISFAGNEIISSALMENMPNSTDALIILPDSFGINAPSRHSLSHHLN